MKDIFDNELAVGDPVAFNPPRYKGLVRGTVIGFSKKMVRIAYSPTGKQHTYDCSVYPRDVVKQC